MGAVTDWRGKRVLVTGASGFVGHHVLAYGRTLGAELHAISRSVHLGDGVTWWQANLLEAATIGRVVSQVKPAGVLHLAAGGVAHGVSDSSDTLRTNLEGIAVLLDALRDSGLRPHVVIASSGFEYAAQNRALREDDPVAPNSVYGVSKAAASLLARLYAGIFPVTVLRLFSLYGPGEREPRITPYVIAQTQRGLPAELTSGGQLRDYTYVADAAEGFWRTLAAPPATSMFRVWNLASGEAVTLRTFVELVADLLRTRGLNPRLLFGAREYRRDEAMTYLADIEQLRSNLGWMPRTSLREGLEVMIDHQLPRQEAPGGANR